MLRAKHQQVAQLAKWAMKLVPESPNKSDSLERHYKRGKHANYYDTNLPGADDVWSGGGTVVYYHGFGRISATAAGGLYAFKVGDFATQWAAQALVGARYTF